ncbi:ribosome-inactivating family protein [Streptomyces roseoverticillatus]|uniref:ribosome-inactivating family protein n=1 Tax=Streptomyces roseoverticillatus TaxID=66429 RepID=UPI0004C08216|nr:ribosome-inactivating family protein [Streptomyces roseoverticillatus]
MTHPTPAKRLGRRLGALLLSVLATCTLVQVTSTAPAQAFPANWWGREDWDVTGMSEGDPAAGSYYSRMVDGIRRKASTGGNTPGIFRTGNDGRNYIEVMVWDHQDKQNPHRISLYIRASNLYLDGFTIEGRNYRFKESPNAMIEGFSMAHPEGDQHWQMLDYTGDYTSGGLQANDKTRGSISYKPQSLKKDLTKLTGIRGAGNDPDIKKSLASIIGATSESARFGWIQTRIATTLTRGGMPNGAHTIEPWGAELENNWSKLSKLVNNLENGRPGNPVSIRIGGDVDTYATLRDITDGDQGKPRLTPLLTLGSAGQ